MPRTISVEQHAVFVTLEDNSQHRVSDWQDWQDAIDMWNAVDDQRREAHASKGIVAHLGRRIKYYEVRSENDPRYRNLPKIDLVFGFQVFTRLYTTDTAAAKAVLEPLGYYGKSGGWVYHQDKRGRERVLVQGWVTAAAATGHHVARLKGEDGYRGTVTTALLVKRVSEVAG